MKKRLLAVPAVGVLLFVGGGVASANPGTGEVLVEVGTIELVPIEKPIHDNNGGGPKVKPEKPIHTDNGGGNCDPLVEICDKV